MTVDVKQVLRNRALALAKPADRSVRRSDNLDLVQFLLAQETYAVEASYVREVYALKELTSLPGLPAFALGVTAIRGRVISILDLKNLFDLPSRGLGDFNKVIVLTDGRMEFGVLADAIVGLCTLHGGDLQPPPPTFAGMRLDFLKGVSREFCVVLDSAKLLSDHRLLVHQTVE